MCCLIVTVSDAYTPVTVKYPHSIRSPKVKICSMNKKLLILFFHIICKMYNHNTRAFNSTVYAPVIITYIRVNIYSSSFTHFHLESNCYNNVSTLVFGFCICIALYVKLFVYHCITTSFFVMFCSIFTKSVQSIYFNLWVL